MRVRTKLLDLSADGCALLIARAIHAAGLARVDIRNFAHLGFRVRLQALQILRAGIHPKAFFQLSNRHNRELHPCPFIAQHNIEQNNHLHIPSQNHVSKACSLERRCHPHSKETSTPANMPSFSQERMCNSICTTPCSTGLAQISPRHPFRIPVFKAIPPYFARFLSTCPKSYAFEILGCLQAVTPLLKFMPQFHSVTPLICSGSQETGQAGASGESQPWVPKGQGETQAARPNRKQLRSSCGGEPFR